MCRGPVWIYKWLKIQWYSIQKAYIHAHVSERDPGISLFPIFRGMFMGEQFFARLQETTNSNHRFSPNQEPKLRAIYYSFSLQLYQSSMPPQLPHFTTEKHSGYIQGQLFDTDSIIAQFNKQKIQYSQMFDQSVIFFDFCSFLADRGHSWWGFMCSSETILDFFPLRHSGGPNIGSLIPSIALPLLILS